MNPRRMALFWRVLGYYVGALAAFGFAHEPAHADEPGPVTAQTAVLHLSNGGYAPGELRDSMDADVLRWQSPAFAAPFDFALNAVNSVHWPVSSSSPKPQGAYCVELSGGDVVFGSLLSLDGEHTELDVSRIGRVRLPRTRVHRIDRWGDSARLVYLGPNGLAGWVETGTEKGWHEEAGQPVSNQPGTWLRANLGLPARAVIEFDISWKAKPDFVLALGTDEDEQSLKRAFRFEVWEGELVVNREVEHEADVAPLGSLGSGPGRAHFLAYLDQEGERLLVYSENGKAVADLKVKGREPRALSGITLGNLRGDVALERLRISQWNGEAPLEASTDQSHVLRTDGTVVSGQAIRYDASSREFLVRSESGETRVAADQMASISLSPPRDEAARSVRVVYQDGVRLSGELRRVADGAIWLAYPGVEEPLRLPQTGLRSLLALHDSSAVAAEQGARIGRLELDGIRLPGRLADGEEAAGASCLAWQPRGSRTASALRPGSSGRIVYREPPPLPPKQPMRGNGQVWVAPVVRGPQPAPPVPLAQQIVKWYSGGEKPAATKPGGRSLHLRTGDMIPCEITRIDETGLYFHTALSDSTFVSHDKVKAIELADGVKPGLRLNKPKRERLLTLPRMQKDSPPTQLIRSLNGDYLRGRVISMDAKTLRVEVRLETKDLPRDRVSLIIWLHADELDRGKKAEKSAPGDGPTRVQALRSDGIRLTFVAERVAAETVSGKSDVLGACRIGIKEVDQLLIGDAIEQAAAHLAYQQWKLRDATEAKVAQADSGAAGAGGRTPGTEAALVGKPAPEFELSLLDGKKFRLADARGKVVVLDFWATWCGPCLQAMPQVERATHEFRDQGVQLIAVNLQESAKDISAMLERHKLDLTVALDVDGLVAEKYGATAIPQTVVIDRDGKIARLFIGGGPHLEEQLHDALHSVLDGPSLAEPVK